MSISKASACLLAAATSLTTLLAPVHAGPVSGQGTWESTLQSRDLDGNGVADAFYDTTLNITWLRNANVNGQMNWYQATNWASTLTVNGYSNWRLPTLLSSGGYTPASSCDTFVGAVFGGINCGTNVIPATSEIASLWYNTLGNKVSSGLSNTGNFVDLQSADYWFGTEYVSSNTGTVWYFNTTVGQQWGGYAKDGTFAYAMAVHDGDLASAHVPEPDSLLLALGGLTCLGLVRRRKLAGA